MNFPSADSHWYKDAILYELHVRAFCDSDGDGVGDLSGLTEKLDYLQDLGVTAIWLLPFYPSPLKDDGYDISDYTQVHAAYGSLADFKVFLREAHQRGLRVITELVLNHTSDQHVWFQRARRAAVDSLARNFYVWSDRTDRYKEARIIFGDFETSNWAWDPIAKSYYWHRFYSHQPDLNYDNPDVRKALFRTVDFWLALGVDGLRLDGVPYLYERENTNCENLPETHAFLKELRAHIDNKFHDRMLLAEANQWPEDAVNYFGNDDACHMAFHFPLMPRMFMAVRMEDRYPILDILQQTPPIPPNSQWAVFLRNHDELTLEMVTDEERDYMYRMYAHDTKARVNLGIRHRLAPLLGKDRKKVELMNALLFSLPGTPVIYYGDEIGMGDNIYLGDRNGVRTPMQWSADRNAGFSRANPQQLYLPIIIDPDYHYEVVNVDACQKNLHSLLWFMKRLIAQRKRFQTFGRGSIEFLDPENSRILAFVRRYEAEAVLVVANLSRFTQFCELHLSSFKGMVPVELFGQTRFPAIGEQPYFLTLGPHNFYWFSLERQDVGTARAIHRPAIVVMGTWRNVFNGAGTAALEDSLMEYLASQKFSAARSPISSVEIQDIVPMPCGAQTFYLVLLQVSFRHSDAELSLIPCAIATGGEVEQVRNHHGDGIIASLVRQDVSEEAVLYEALSQEEFRRSLLQSIRRRRRFRGSAGEVFALQTLLDEAEEETGSYPESSLVNVNRVEAAIIYKDGYILKFFRHLIEGMHPDLEMTVFLSQRMPSSEAPELAGVLEYRRKNREPVTLAILQRSLQRQEDAWQLTIESLGRFYERVMATSIEPPDLRSLRSSLLDLIDKSVPEPISGLVGSYLETARILGQRTAKLHLILSTEVEHTDFTPEPFTKLYQRAVYQSLRNLTHGVLGLLEERLGELPEGEQEKARRVLNLAEQIIARFKPLLGRKIDAARIRIHGDYHLGHLRYTGKDFVVASFGRDRSGQRRLKKTALRDAASMIRSFHAAAYAALFDQVKRGVVATENVPRLEAWAPVWVVWVSSSFLKAYLEASGQASFLPSSRDEMRVLLNACLLERFVEELGDELNNNNADWIGITLKGILQIMQMTL
jgi:maltose alpha-D-glucosyltransferase/alpha-amylase